jgi:putative SOS response-associated peptidase YedK
VCGRFALFASPELLVEYFALTESEPSSLAPHYNVTPGQDIAAARIDRDGKRRLVALRWGLVPFWAKDASIGRRLVNARLDSLASKPAFREALTRRRCLIAASGFYEWGEGPHSTRQPFFVRPRRDPLLALAGLWERWRSPDGTTLESCVIVTTEANALLAPIHDRMPLMVARAEHDRWLDPATPPSALADLAARAPELDAFAVGKAVNDPRNDDEKLIEPLRAASE